MKAEIIAVGTELLLGQIVNTNAQFLAESCAEIGVDVYFQTVVGDNRGRIREAFDIARKRAELIICTGGLGPTQDDLTKDVLAEYTGRQLYIHQPSMDKIEELFRSRGTVMVESNARQAHLLTQSDPLANDTGLAVGAALTFEGTHFILLPGPPKEMKPMFKHYAVPWIQSKMGGVQPLFSKVLKFSGIGESNLEHQLIDLIQTQRDPSIAPYAKEGEVMIRLTTRAASQAEAESRIEPVEREIRSRVGEYIYADEDMPIEQAVLRRLGQSGRTVAVAESCTGGLLSDMFTAIPGSSQVFLGGVVCYTNALKNQLLDVPLDVLEGIGAPGAVSKETAALLAENVRRKTNASVSVAITGVAGPAESEGKPVGTVFVGIAREEGTVVEQLKLSGNRESIKLKAAKNALYLLWKQL
ncbi:competence/damage-inducible protein A [Paenibacillus thalictri]|uniref:Putative competence-damage inducible protein n=1 Tax=Paenibacillus thalictri TaxID=2527873 RepID=A0A4Q9DP13_9BACL|nr:competence/damage-inducible protein A [Paenibacillus thalictri]TBL77801.1 competence/damage-inducible protein A [Paenibacillus thalictri]